MKNTGGQAPSIGKTRQKQDADYIFHELTRSICPECKKVLSAYLDEKRQVLNKVRAFES
ncbi:MAG: hypothetical protein IIB42_04895 [Candidatus Marinimicrobia bacterium]|nr:hypothetical protein [Candidatus Neomarinimicrobiota bacterium]